MTKYKPLGEWTTDELKLAVAAEFSKPERHLPVALNTLGEERTMNTARNYDPYLQGPQAHVNDIDVPGYSCPPRVEDLLSRGGWGWAPLHQEIITVAQDEKGFLWVPQNCLLSYQILDVTHILPGVVFYATEGGNGIGVWIPKGSLRHIGFVNQEEALGENWLPISEASNIRPPNVPDH